MTPLSKPAGRLLSDAEVNYINFGLRLVVPPTEQKRTLQRLCEWYEDGRLMQDATSTRQLIHSLIGSDHVLVRRWAIKALALIGHPEDFRRIAERLRVEEDAEAQTWGVTGLVKNAQDRGLKEICELAGLSNSAAISLAARLYQIACITFTDNAREEIAREIEMHPAILVDTIHGFAWAFLSKFQKSLRDLVGASEERQGAIAEAGGIHSQRVDYKLGFFGIDADRITLHHDDIPKYFAALMANVKFRNLLREQFPIIFIDEYQDTDPLLMKAFSEHFCGQEDGPLIGLFGDHWQTIYRSDYDLAEFAGVEGIDKGANFRSERAIVNVLNALRPELTQELHHVEAPGEARFFHANGYQGERTNTAHAKADLPDALARQYVAGVTKRLEDDGWDMVPAKTKILMLTHNALAAEQGYPAIASIFDRKEAFAKKEDALIEFLVGTVEPLVAAYQRGSYGEMFRLVGKAPTIRAHADKLSWRADMDALRELRVAGTIGQVIDHLKKTRRPRLADGVAKREEEIERLGSEPAEDEPRSITRHRALRDVSYSELIQLVKYLEGHTPFATQHSVKGAQFENVLVILGGGWNHYNWPRLLEIFETKVLTPQHRQGFFRARNLLYVALSRPEKRLAVLATQTLGKDALATAARLFGAENVHEFTP